MTTAYYPTSTPFVHRSEPFENEYDYFFNPEIEEEQFLGSVVRKVSRPVAKVARSVNKKARKAVNSTYKTAKRGARTVYKGVRTGTRYAGKVGKIATTFTRPPGLSGTVNFGRDVIRGRNIGKAFRSLAKSGISDIRERMRHAQIAASFVPGIGTGVAAAMGAANALAAGRPISDAVIEAARSAIPGGPLAQAAFDVGINLAKGRSLSQAALNAARNRLPPAGRAAFDTAVALGKGQNLQKAAWRNAGQLLPASPYINSAASFVRQAGRGKSLQYSALSGPARQIYSNVRREMELEIPEISLPATDEELEIVRRSLRRARPLSRKTRPRPRVKRPRPPGISRFRPRPVIVRRPAGVALPTQVVEDRQPPTEYMRWVQRALNDVLGLNLIVDGVPDRATRDAIRDFQKQHQLPVDGIAGPALKDALKKARTDYFRQRKPAA